MPFSAAGQDFDCRPAQARRFQRAYEFDLLTLLSFYFTRPSEIFHKSIQNFIGSGKHSAEMIE